MCSNESSFEVISWVFWNSCAEPTLFTGKSETESVGQSAVPEIKRVSYERDEIINRF